MGRPPAGNDKAKEQAIELARLTDDGDTLRVAQAVLLPLLGSTLEQTAQAVGRDRYWISKARNRMLRGKPPPTKHGGRRRSLLAEDEEVALVKEAISRTWAPGTMKVMTLRETLRTLLEEHQQSSQSEPTLSRILQRAAPKILPGLAWTQATFQPSPARWLASGTTKSRWLSSWGVL